jgi:RNA-directed DNA polymerase
MSNQNPFIVDFTAARNDQDLAKYIGTTNDLMKRAALKENRSKFYRLHKIPKLGNKFKRWHRRGDSYDFASYLKHQRDKRGNNHNDKYRIVWALLDEDLIQAHKNFARRFGDFVLSKGYIHASAFGYIKKIGILENAQVHSGATLLLRADISNFFPSISGETLATVFKKLNLNIDIIQTLVDFLTIDNSLPLGFNSSPMLANIVCCELDKQINDLASKYGCKYTRYADDISISGEKALPTQKELSDIIQQGNFTLSESKFRITKKGQAHYVTGLSISDHQPHAPRILKKKLRQELYYCKKFGIRSHLSKLLDLPKDDVVSVEYQHQNDIQKGINRLHGTACYVSHIEKSPELLKTWFELVKNNGCNITYVNKMNLTEVYGDLSNLELLREEPGILEFYIDETEIEDENKVKFLALAFSAIEQNKIQNISDSIKTILEDDIAHPWAGSRKTDLIKDKLHFNTANQDLKNKCIDYLLGLNYKTYIAYGILGEGKKNYKNTYIKLVKNILMVSIWRKKIYAGKTLMFNFEENNKISQEEIKKLVIDSYTGYFTSLARRPCKSPEVKIANKSEHYCLTYLTLC